MTSILISTSAEFKNYCNRIKSSPFIALDTEFMRNKTYWAQLCLLQIADKDNQNVAVVDCLADDMDLSPLKEILENPNVVKVFHAARQDLEILYNKFDLIPLPLFDSQVAAMACGLGDQIGYDILVKKIQGADIDKSSRFKDWRTRPLSKADIDYAAGDVTYLTKAYEWLQDYLDTHSRNDWITDEMAKLTDPLSYRNDPEWAWLKLKMKGDQVQKSILRELAIFREKEAQRRNVPRGHVLKDDMIYALAKATPKDYGALKEAANLHGRNYKGDFANYLLQAIKKGIATASQMPDVQLSKKESKGGQGVKSDVLKMILKISADEYNVAARLIADSEDLAKLAGSDYKTSRTMQGWRYEVFGKRAENFLKGKTSIRLIDGKLCLDEEEAE